MSAETAPTTIGLESAPLTPAEAEAKLNELTADTEAGRSWSAKWLGGDAATVAEFKTLVEAKNAKPAGGDFLSRVINGTAELPLVDSHSGNTLTVRNQMLLAELLRDLGFTETSVRQYFDGTPNSKEVVDAAESLRADRLADPEWTKRWLNGGRAERREMALMTMIRLNGVATKAV